MMIDFLEYFGMIGIESSQQIVTAVARIILACILGAAIGTERGRKHHPAGLRTHMLVCVAAALAMITNEQLIYTYGSGDPTRMGAQVISGIGFLGAGTILTDKQNRVRGLTTAAGLWASACMGLAVGGGFYIGAIAVCILMLLIFTKFVDVEHRFIRKGKFMELMVSFDEEKNLMHFLIVLTSHHCNITSLEYLAPDSGEAGVRLQLHLPRNNYQAEILEVVEHSRGVVALCNMK